MMTSFDKEQVFEIVNIAKEAMEQRESGFFPALIKHQQDDAKNFEEIRNTLQQILDNQKVESSFRTDLQALSDFIKGLGLLRKPVLWILGLVLGIVALMGGLKTILSWFIIR